MKLLSSGFHLPKCIAWLFHLHNPSISMVKSFAQHPYDETCRWYYLLLFIFTTICSRAQKFIF